MSDLHDPRDLWFYRQWDAECTLRATRPDAWEILTPDDVDFEMSFKKSRRFMKLDGITQAGLEHFVTNYGATYEYIVINRSKLLGDLSPLEDLPSLRGIRIDWNIRAERLWNLARNPLLTHLSIDGAKKLSRRLEGLSSGQSLEVVTVYASVESKYPMDTLDVFADLPRLRTLTLSYMRPADRRTDFLDTLPALETFNFDRGMFTTEEIAALCVRYPHLGGWHMGAYHQWENSTQAEVSGKGKPTLELPRDRARLDKYIAAFEALLEKERNTP